MKDEALKLALEALETELAVDMTNGAEVGEAAELMCEAITAIKQALAAPVQPVFELQESGWEIICDLDWIQTLPFGTKLYTAPPAAQPAVPDAFGTREGEHPQYIQGWNDCRAEMLKGMKT
jgi:hypothetical protein